MIQKLTMNRLLWLLVVAAIAFVSGCRKDEPQEIVSSKLAADYDARVAVKWNELFLEIDRYAPGYRPPAAARMLAYTGLAAYESAVPGMTSYQSMESKFAGLRLPEVEPGREYHWPSAVNAAYASMFKYFYPHVDPGYLIKINQLEQQFQDEFGRNVSAEVRARSAAFGSEVADAVARWSETDTHGHEAFRDPHPASYTPPTTGPNGEVLWQPTLPDYTGGLFPGATCAPSPSTKTTESPVRPSPLAKTPTHSSTTRPMRSAFGSTTLPTTTAGSPSSGATTSSS